MDRRYFLGSSIVAPLAAMSAGCSDGRSASNADSEGVPLILPGALRKGMTVGLIAPASPVRGEGGYDKAVNRVRRLGYKPRLFPHAQDTYGYLAGSDEHRLEDLHQAFASDDIDAIWCLRGGYGTLRLLEALDFDLIRKHPKVLIGYSDITALHAAIQRYAGLVTFHGPMPGAAISSYAAGQLQEVVGKAAALGEVPPPEESRNRTHGAATIVGGTCRGRLVGGNLTLVSRLMGTPFEPNLDGNILFLEDIGEAPYRVDGMLSHLKLTRKIRKCAGILLGRFTGSKASEATTLDLKQVFRDLLGDLGIPIYYGFPTGHVPDQTTVPMGIEAEMDADTGRVSYLEPAVVG